MDEKNRPTLIEDKAFWLALACVLIILSSIWLFDYSGIVGNVVQSVSYMDKDSELLISTTDVEGLYLAKLTFAELVNGATIKIEEDKNIKFDGIAYSKFNMSFSNGEKLKSVKFTLKLKESTLKLLGLSKDNVKLYAGSKELPVLSVPGPALDSSQDHIYFEAVSLESGEFVIGKMKVVEKKTEITPVVETKVVENKVEEKLVVLEKEQPKQVQKPAPVQRNVFSKIIDFFKNLFN